jgi:hypothetical protein
MKNNINMKLMQLEWVKKELKWESYEFSKILSIFILFLYLKSITKSFFWNS